jgi:hypothetical protein
MSRYRGIDLNRVKTYPVRTRKSRTQVSQLAKPLGPESSMRDFLNHLPKCLKAEDFKALVTATLKARQKNKPIILMLGAHPIKCGLSPLLVDLMQDGFVTCLATNGAGAIHDLEMAFWGRTSEEVEKGIDDGSFGMARETGEIFNRISSFACRNDLGLGEALGRRFLELRAKFKKTSLLAQAYRLAVPACVHVAFGTDIVHQHPSFDPASTGVATHQDFRILADQVSRLNNGGVVLHFGSTVILPEVFLKALSVARNVKGPVESFTTANFDMIQHYRPNMNLVLRPTQRSGKGFSFTGHHEIMIPLLAWALKSSTKTKRR